MTIWILAALFMISSAAAGLRQGAIRTVFSLVGIPVAAWLAVLLAGYLKPVFKVLGVTNPVLVAILGFVVVFIVILCVFKGIGFAVHKKLDTFYKYKASELQHSLWQRMSSRLGMCLGLANGLMYAALISTALYFGSYWTVQLATPDKDPWTLRFFNQLGKDLEVTGMSQVAAALDWLPETYYSTADLAGLVFQNPLLEARLSRYPGFLSLGERPEFQSLANDQSLTEMRLKGASVRELMSQAQVKQIVGKPETLKLLWDTAVPDLRDLRMFLESGKSAKYDTEPILGRWVFNVGSSMAAYRKEKPNVPNSETQRLRQWMTERFSKAKIVAAPDRLVVIKDYPKLSPAGAAPSPTVETQTLAGKWKGGDGDYVLTMDTTAEERTARVENGKWVMKQDTLPLVFDKEE
jgi:hypothetical protein